MDWSNILDDVIGNVQPDCVPVEFVLSAQYTDRFGNDHPLQGRELSMFMANPKQFPAREARVVLDISGIRRIMIDHVNQFFNDLDQQLHD